MVRRAAQKKVKLSDSRACLRRHKRASKVALPENVRRRSTYRHSASTRNNRKKENKIKKQNKKCNEKRVDNYAIERYIERIV